MMRDEQFLADIRGLAAKIKDNWSLCEFAGKSEAEYMVAQTIHAARINLDAHGEPFSFKGTGLNSTYGNGLIDNPAGYRLCLERGWFEEDTRLDRPVIFPTRKLLDDLSAFFSRLDQSPSPADEPGRGAG